MRYEKPITNELYHVYNRGVEKRKTFLDEDDYHRFLMMMDIINTTDKVNIRDLFEFGSYDGVGVTGNWKFHKGNYVKIHAFCLMENHYHLLLEPLVEGALEKFMQRCGTSYTKYFNTKYKRVGGLFGGAYQYKQLESEGDVWSVKKYIHCQNRSIKYWRGLNNQT